MLAIDVHAHRVFTRAAAHTTQYITQHMHTDTRTRAYTLLSEHAAGKQGMREKESDFMAVD